MKIKTFVRKQQFELHTDTTSLSPDWLAWPTGGVGHTSCTSGTNSTSAAHHRWVLNLKRVRKKMTHLPTLKREPTELLSSLMCIHIKKRLSPENKNNSFLRFLSTPYGYILVSHHTNNVIYFKPLARIHHDQINQYNDISNFTQDVKLNT